MDDLIQRGNVYRTLIGLQKTMGKLIPSCELWRKEESGAGSGNVWDAVLSLGRRADGSFRLSHRRHPKDYYEYDDRIAGPFTICASSPFRRPERLLDLLENELGDGDDWPELDRAETLLALVELLDFEPEFAKEALRLFSVRLK